jgi:AbrB family looped-hinge helix DNA binding protein
MVEVKVSKKFQVVIPKEVRKNVSLSAGDQLIVKVEEGKIVMMLKPKSYTEHMHGLHKKIWKHAKVERYVEEERKSWRER